MSERIYDIDGKKLPSVTTILGCLNKPALMPWAVKMTTEAMQQLIYDHGIHNQLEGTITLSWEDDNDGHMGLENMLAQAKKAYRAKSKEAMSIGTAVHEAIQNWIESEGRMQPEEIADEQIRRGLESFLTWGTQHDIEIVSYEQVVSDNKTYAGRFDLLAHVDGKLTLIDFKTSTGIWPEYWLQVAGYADCLVDVDMVAILRIDKETGEIEYQDRLDWFKHAEAFRLLANFYNLNKTLEGDKKRGNKN